MKTIASHLAIALLIVGVSMGVSQAATQGGHHTHREPTRTVCKYSDGNPDGSACYRAGRHGLPGYWIGTDGWIHYDDGVTFKLDSYR